MKTRVLIIGGYGNFGRFIAQRLSRETDLHIIIAGRSLAKAQAEAERLSKHTQVEAAQLDINDDLLDALQAIKPAIVIHTSGPFQSQSYGVAQTCIDYGCHYIDLADGRAFVTGITALHQSAHTNSIFVCSGCSSVPTLTSAIIDHYLPEFSQLESADYAISTAQKTSRGLATTAAVLSYAGKPFNTVLNGASSEIYGWLDLRRKSFWGLGKRLLGNCDVPDLTLFLQRYPTLKTLRFQAGLELAPIHFVLFSLSWLVRLRLLLSLQPLASGMLAISRLFDWLGSDKSGFYMTLAGQDKQGQPLQLQFDLLAEHGDGMYIPCVPAILLAIKLARGEIPDRGAYPCMGFIRLDEYLNLLAEFSVRWNVTRQ